MVIAASDALEHDAVRSGGLDGHLALDPLLTFVACHVEQGHIGVGRYLVNL